MEKREAICVLVVFAVIGASAGESIANFKDCYELCFLGCVITPGNKLFSCATKCVAQCVFSKSNGGEAQLSRLGKKEEEAYNFCQLGCSISLCTNFSTVNNPGGGKVARCVGSCGKKCS